MSPEEKMKIIVDYAPSQADNDIVKEGLIRRRDRRHLRIKDSWDRK